VSIRTVSSVQFLFFQEPVKKDLLFSPSNPCGLLSRSEEGSPRAKRNCFVVREVLSTRSGDP
jgi:hypothetical protein